MNKDNNYAINLLNKEDKASFTHDSDVKEKKNVNECEWKAVRKEKR